MKRLIINADDLGADEARNRGIFEAIEAGRVTSVSILVNGDGFEDAMERWKSLGKTEISLGIHINLSEGRPISEDLRILTGQDGLFRGKQATHILLKQPSEVELEREIQKEIKAQIDLLKAFKTPIAHLDGHQHIHIAPVVLPIALSEASKSKIQWIRIPDEPHPSITSLMAKADTQDETVMFSNLGMAARSSVMLSEIESCDHFRGLYLKGKLDIALLDELLQNLPMGLTELMVHPGRVADTLSTGPFAAFSSIERERELTTLLDPVFPTLLEKYGIHLIPFPENLS
jgi:chitin disaccharide deacetylase